MGVFGSKTGKVAWPSIHPRRLDLDAWGRMEWTCLAGAPKAWVRTNQAQFSLSVDVSWFNCSFPRFDLIRCIFLHRAWSRWHYTVSLSCTMDSINSTSCLIIQDLLFSYNIAVDRSDEMKKILNKSAASVGLQLPDVYQPWGLLFFTYMWSMILPYSYGTSFCVLHSICLRKFGFQFYCFLNNVKWHWFINDVVQWCMNSFYKNQLLLCCNSHNI